jgi:hypothetical protein
VLPCLASQSAIACLVRLLALFFLLFPCDFACSRPLLTRCPPNSYPFLPPIQRFPFHSPCGNVWDTALDYIVAHSCAFADGEAQGAG